MLNFSDFIQLSEDATLNKSLLLKDNPSTSEKRFDILIRVIKNNTPIKTANGKKAVIADAENSIQSVLNYVSGAGKRTLVLPTIDGKKLKLTDIALVSPFNWGGSGAGGGTKQTKMQEAAQCVWCAAMVGRGSAGIIDDYTNEILRLAYRDTNIGKTTLQEVLALSQDDTFRYSLYETARTLFENGYIKNGMRFHRNSNTIKQIHAAKQRAFANSGLIALSNDRWNPGDIWAIDKNVKIPGDLNTSSTRALQKRILELFNARQVVSISLKTIREKKIGQIEEYNREIPPENTTFKMVKASPQSGGDIGDFWTAKYGVILYDSNGELRIKPDKAMGSMRIEIYGRGARGGSAGWLYIQEQMKNVLGADLPSLSAIKKIANGCVKKNLSELNTAYEMFNRAEMMTRADFDKNIADKQNGWIYSKYAVCAVISVLNRVSPTKANDFITSIVNYAESRNSNSTVFVKVY